MYANLDSQTSQSSRDYNNNEFKGRGQGGRSSYRGRGPGSTEQETHQR